MKIYVHATFLLLLAWVALSHLARGQGVAAAAKGLVLVLAVFAIVVVHELSHALVARRFGIRTRDITLLPIGGVASLERIPEKPLEELLVTLAGPATNIVLAGALAGILAATGGSFAARQLALVGGPLLPKLLWINVSLAVFNLLPAFPMDGGRVLRALLALRMDHDRATTVAANVGQGMAILFALLGFFSNPLLVVIALFVWVGASQESSLTRLRSVLNGIPVRNAMITHFSALSPGEPLSKAADLLVAGFQHDFPVLEEGHPVGVLGRHEVMKGVAQGGLDRRIEEVMQRSFAAADPSEMMGVVLERLQRHPTTTLLVLKDGRLVGLLTPENLGELVMIERARRGARS